jgi:hypothetical protein
MAHAAVVTWSASTLGIDWGDRARSGETLERIGFVRDQTQKLQGHGSPSALCAETPPWLVEAGVLRVH